MIITQIIIWCTCIGLTVGFYFLHKEITLIEKNCVTREEFDIEHRRTAQRIEQIRENVRKKK